MQNRGLAMPTLNLDWPEPIVRVRARRLEFFQSNPSALLVDWTIVLHERGEARGAGHNSQIVHRVRPEFSGKADAAADFKSHLICDDASHHDGVVARPEGGIPEAEAIASVSVIFDQ
jgi:hypothetical protein